MGEFQQHPDGLVFVRSDAGVYVDTMQNFALDSSVILPPLPPGANERVYEQKVRHALTGGGNVIDGGPMPWDIGDGIIDSVSRLLVIQKTRQDAAAAAKAADAEAARKAGVAAAEALAAEIAAANAVNATAAVAAKAAAETARVTSEAAKAAAEAAAAAEKARLGPILARRNQIRAQADVADLIQRLKTATPAQIDTWVDNNGAKALRAIAKILATQLD